MYLYTNGKVYRLVKYTFHAPLLIVWLADERSLMCYIVIMGRVIAKMFSTFSL